VLRKLRQPLGNYQAPIFWSVVMGSLLCVGYYALLRYGPVSLPLLERYSKCHAVAYATVELFFISLCALVYKLLESSRQVRLLGMVKAAIDEIKIARNDELINDPSTQTQWLQSAWKTQSTAVFQSWFGQRIRDILASQIRRQSMDQLDEDIRIAAERDADLQHDSYALVRILTWAMPMLGFLGTVLGISETLGQMDASALASGSQDAMNGLTAGLYVAFDTTAIGLILTMAVMFFQFAVNKSEIKLLGEIDRHTSDLINSCVIQKTELPDLSNVRESLKVVGQGILLSMEQLVQKQAELWQESMKTAETRWLSIQENSSVQLSEALAKVLTNVVESTHRSLLDHHEKITTWSTNHEKSSVQLSEELSLALTKVVESTQKSLLDHHEKIASLHSREVDSIDARIQEWQHTISEQSKAMLSQQRENANQTELLHQLIEKSELVKSMEEPLQATLKKLSNIDRFHDAAICLTEAVAVLGTQMERYGYLGRQPVRRRSEAVEKNDERSDNREPAIIPIKRKAG
jgi:biopolymer transport protein ExbB/TolQ